MITRSMNGGAMQFYCRGWPQLLSTIAYLLKALREMMALFSIVFNHTVVKGTVQPKLKNTCFSFTCGATYLSTLRC